MRAKRSAAVWLTLLASAIAAAGCDDRPPAVPTRDGGPRRDASVPQGDAGLDAGYRRPDAGPTLPPADLEIVLPYRGPPVTTDLAISADLGALDVALLVDTTGSFGGEIDQLQASLDGRIVPALGARVSDVAFAVARFEDFPIAPFGVETDHPFYLHQAITTDAALVGAAVATLDSPLGNGGDLPESGAEALYQIATGMGFEIDGTTIVERFGGIAAPGGGVIGGAGFREGSLRVVVQVTDAPTHTPESYGEAVQGAHGVGDAISALDAIDAFVLGIASGEPARTDLETVAIATGAVVEPVGGSCITGRPPTLGTCPLVFDIGADGRGLSDAIVDAMTGLLDTITYREVWGEAREDSLRFVRAVEAASAEPAGGSDPPGRADRRPMDGVDDTFTDVRPGTRATFRAVLVNETVPPADYDQVFRVVVRVLGDSLVLVERTIRIVVPRGRLDAGVDASEVDASAMDAATSDAGTGEIDAALELDAGLDAE